MFTKSALTGFSAVLALGLAAAGQSASAQTADTVSIKVSYADLNLSTEAGAKVMLQRIRNAAKTICDPSPDSTDLLQDHLYRSCVNTITDHSVARFNNPIVTALNSGKSAPASMALASNR
ncbi:MAG: UrcA family protein [Caulobacteraceae bacterium]